MIYMTNHIQYITTSSHCSHLPSVSASSFHTNTVVSTLRGCNATSPPIPWVKHRRTRSTGGTSCPWDPVFLACQVPPMFSLFRCGLG